MVTKWVTSTEGILPFTVTVTALSAESDAAISNYNYKNYNSLLHIMKRTSLALLTSILLCCLGMLPSCSSDSEPPMPGEGDGNVKLLLNLMVSSSGDRQAMKAPGADNAAAYDFELPDHNWEGVRTLRVIIVRKELGTVEHNTLLSIDNPLTELIENQVFYVKGGERKQIYFIANEESLTSGQIGILKGISVGGPMPDVITDIVMQSNGPVFIDNSALTAQDIKDGKGSNIPMAEQFEKDIIEPASKTGTTTQRETFFITRSSVKFSFTIDPASFSDEKVKNPRSFQITELTVTGLANQEYLFPTNTTYAPAKNEVSTNKYSGRLITAYSCPAATATSSYTFLPTNFGQNLSKTTSYDMAYAPAVYFHESPVPSTGGYTLTLKAFRQGDPEPFNFGPVVLPNLSSLPRNTHVKVNLKFNAHGVSCTVALVPYTGVWLFPTFGIDSEQ